MSDFDDLAEAARTRSRTDYAHIDISLAEYGVAIVVRDEEPITTYDEGGNEFGDSPQGSVITAGFGPDIATAMAAALANLTPAQPITK